MNVPMKGTLTRQVNIKITESDFQDLEFLRASGVDIGELLRPDLQKRLRQAKKLVAEKLNKAG
jgi:peroxiredoxin